MPTSHGHKKKLKPLPERAAIILEKLRKVKGISEDEKALHALGLAATPQERWEMFERNARLFGSWKHLNPKRQTSWSSRWEV